MSKPISETGIFRVLAAIDLEEGSERILREAISLATAQPKAELHVMTVPEVIGSGFPSGRPEPTPDQVAAGSLQDFVAKALYNHFGTWGIGPLQRVYGHVAVGRPSDEIVWFAAHLQADMLVIGTHGRRGLKRVLMGSVAERVMRTAGCSVVVVREPQHRSEWVVPEIEPVCKACAQTRRETGASELWCADHRERHYFAKSYISRAGDSSGPMWGPTTL